MTFNRVIASTARPTTAPVRPPSPRRRTRAYALRTAAALALMISLGACADTDAVSAEPVTAAGGGAAEEAAAGAPGGSTAEPAVPDACDLLTAEQIAEASGLVVSIRVDVPDQCSWQVPNPADSHYNALVVDVDGFASVEEATRLFQPYVHERVTGIGDEASIATDSQVELSIRVGATKITLIALNPAVTPDVIRALGRTAATKAAS